MFEEIDEPKDFLETASWRAARTVLVLNKLNGILYKESLEYVGASSFGAKLRIEKTKAWYMSEYWAYVLICKEFDLERKPGCEIFDWHDIPALTAAAKDYLFNGISASEALRRHGL